MSHKSKLIAANIVQIDPINCASTVSYRIVEESYGLESSVTLTDCTDTITWYFGKSSGPDKIDIAIKMLQEFKKKHALAIKNHIPTEGD